VLCQTIVLHYLSYGAAYLSFIYHKKVYLAPIVLILKALKSECDKYLFDRLMAGHEDDTYYRGFVYVFNRSYCCIKYVWLLASYCLCTPVANINGHRHLRSAGWPWPARRSSSQTVSIRRTRILLYPIENDRFEIYDRCPMSDVAMAISTDADTDPMWRASIS